jgi:pimeloyl-ACP methyl ester carboxylesterase
MRPWPGIKDMARYADLFYYDTGPGDRPAMILIHGLGDEADTWRHLIPLLGDQYRVLAPDLPGFGRSKPGSRISRKNHTRAVLRLLEETGPAVLAGSSMGAIIAEDAALTRPDLVQNLILIDGCFPMTGRLNPGFYFNALPFWGKKRYRAFRKNHTAAYGSLHGYYANLEGLSQADRDFLQERVIARVESDTQEAAYFASLRSIIVTHLFCVPVFSRKLCAFPGRILLLWGEKDRVLPRNTADRLRALRPDAVFKVIGGAGHLPHQEKPEETAAAILQFLV